MFRLPAEQLASAVNVEDVVIVAGLDHPGLDEAVLLEDFFLEPGARPGDRLRNADGGPFLAVERAADNVLNLFIAERLRLAAPPRQLRRKVATPFDQPGDRFGEIVEVDEGLVRAEHARI